MDRFCLISLVGIFIQISRHFAIGLKILMIGLIVIIGVGIFDGAL